MKMKIAIIGGSAGFGLALAAQLAEHAVDAVVILPEPEPEHPRLGGGEYDLLAALADAEALGVDTVFVGGDPHWRPREVIPLHARPVISPTYERPPEDFPPAARPCVLKKGNARARRQKKKSKHQARNRRRK